MGIFGRSVELKEKNVKEGKMRSINGENLVIHGYTLPETNIFAPENGWLEYQFPFGKAYFQVLCHSFREGKWIREYKWILLHMVIHDDKRDESMRIGRNCY